MDQNKLDRILLKEKYLEETKGLWKPKPYVEWLEDKIIDITE